MDRVYRVFSGYGADFETDVCDAKMLVMREAMASELGVLATELAAIAGSHWASRDFTRNAIGEALRNVAAQFPIYRTYVTPRRVSDQDRRYIGWAVARARKTAHGDTTVYDFLESVLDTSLVRRRGAFYKRGSVFDFAMHFQQYTGPVMAKGYEDTALYRYNRLIALNEVGAIRAASGYRWVPFTKRTGTGGAAIPTACWPRPRTIPSAARTCARASTSCRR